MLMFQNQYQLASAIAIYIACYASAANAQVRRLRVNPLR